MSVVCVLREGVKGIIPLVFVCMVCSVQSFHEMKFKVKLKTAMLVISHIIFSDPYS